MQIHEVHQKIKEAFPNWQTQAERYKQEVAKYVTSESTILDIGAGRSGYMVDLFQTAKHVIGQDPDEQAISEHPFLHQKIIGDFDSLSIIPDHSVDMVISSWTLEHLKKPHNLFIQVSRILKKGGVFISLTPNKYCIPSVISMLIPNSLHPSIVKKLWGRSEENTYPAYYKLNTVRALKKYCKQYSLNLKEVQYMKDPSYYVQMNLSANSVYKLHRKLPSKLAEGMLITIEKPFN
jgi:ubiquinone/menaquinone biosynthesis C-methylase UbiE